MSYVSTLIANLSAATKRAHAHQAIASAIETLEGRQLLSTVSISSPSVNEGGNLVYNVTLNAASSKAVTVNYSLAGGTAKVNTDYTSIKPAKLTFAPGETSKTITVKTKDNKVFSSAKSTVFVRITAPTAGNSIKGSGLGVGSIVNTDTAPVITISNAATTEGQAGNKVLTFTVKMTGAASVNPVKVNYSTSNVSTISTGKNADYVTTKGTLTFTAINKPQTIKVTIHGDKIAEADEAFLVNLKGAGFTVTNPLVPGKAFAVGSIKNDDGGSVSAGTTVTSTPASVSVNPGSTAGVTLTLNHISADPVTVHYATANGTAVAGTDFTGTSDSSVTFNPGETSKTITVDTASAATPGTNFNVNLLTSTTNASPANTGSTINITAAPLPSLSVSDTTIAEGNAGVKNASVTVSLSAAATQPITVGYSTANGLASAGSDYTATTGTLTFAVGETSKTINIPILGDTTPESNETFTVNLGAPVNAPITKSFGTVTITDDDTDPTAGPNDGQGLAFDDGSSAFNFDFTKGDQYQYAQFAYSITSTRSTALNNLSIAFYLVPADQVNNLSAFTPYRTDSIGSIAAGQTVTGQVDASGSTPPPSGTGNYSRVARIVLNGVQYDTENGPGPST